ncbi:MAG: flagellum-specific ATP synthase FliI, partial [Pseudomonadota bacterium]
DPLAEAAKSILDGHIVLSRELAESGHYPAIDVLSSTSRLKNAVTDIEHQQAAQLFIYFYSVYQRNKDLLSVGMYQRGDNPDLDKAIDLLPAMLALLTQTDNEKLPFDQCRTALLSLLSAANG